MWAPKVPMQVLDSGRPGISWGIAGVTACHPVTQRCITPLLCYNWYLGAGICSAGAVSHKFSVATFLYPVPHCCLQTLQMPLFWSLIAKLSGVRTAFEIIGLLSGLEFQVLVGWVHALGDHQSRKKKKMMCNHLCTQCWTHTELEKLPTVKEKSFRYQLCIFDVKMMETKPQPLSEFLSCIPKNAPSLIHVGKESVLGNSFSFPLIYLEL